MSKVLAKQQSIKQQLDSLRKERYRSIENESGSDIEAADKKAVPTTTKERLLPENDEPASKRARKEAGSKKKEKQQQDEIEVSFD